MDELNAVLLALYATAREASLAEFRGAALALCRPLVPFTSATWATGKIHSEGVVHHSVQLFGESADRLVDYEAVKHEDIAVFTVGKNPDRAFTFHAPSLYRESRYGGIRGYARRWDHDNCILCSHYQRSSDLFQWLGVYRGAAFEQYGEFERKTVELLLPHLIESLTINWKLCVEAPIATVPLGAAIADRFGVLHHTNPRFLELVGQEWPKVSGRQLPSSYAEHLGRSSGDRYVGRRIVVTARPVRDLHLLNVRQKMPVDELSERELAVARYIAQGFRYREIARRLGLSPATVRNYTQAIHQRLGVRTNTEMSLQLQATERIEPI